MNVPIKVEYLLPLCLIFLLIWILVFHKGEKNEEIKVPPLPPPKTTIPQVDQETEDYDNEPDKEEKTEPMEIEALTEEPTGDKGESPTMEQRRQFYANQKQKEELEQKEKELEQAKETLEYEQKKKDLENKHTELNLKSRENAMNVAAKTLKEKIKQEKERAEIEKEKKIWLNQND